MAFAPRLLPLVALTSFLLFPHGLAFVVPQKSGSILRQQNEKRQSALPQRRDADGAISTRPVFSTSTATTRLYSVKGRVIQTSSSFASILIREVKELSRIQKGILVATFIVGYLLGKCKPFWKRYTSVMDIPSSMFGENAKVLRGRAISVSDGDTIRFLHAPTWFSPTSLRKGEKASEVALPIRISTIDTPETAKFGKSGQPFGPEAKENLKKLLENKRVSVKLLQRDQYSRGVASVYTGRLIFKKHVDEQMLRDGLAEVYTGGGAVYGPKGLDGYLALQDEAQEKKIGIWSLKKRESAAEYKKRTK